MQTENSSIQELERALEREMVLREKCQRILRIKEDQWEQELESLHARIDVERERHAAELDALTLVCLQKQEALDAVLRSTSWRITGPLRALARGIPVKFGSKSRIV